MTAPAMKCGQLVTIPRRGGGVLRVIVVEPAGPDRPLCLIEREDTGARADCKPELLQSCCEWTGCVDRPDGWEEGFCKHHSHQKEMHQYEAALDIAELVFGENANAYETRVREAKEQTKQPREIAAPKRPRGGSRGRR